MIRIILAAAFLLWLTPSYAAVDVPEFSFTGEDIAGHRLPSSFTRVELSFSGESSFDTYLKSRRMEFTEGEGADYTAEDPGAMYSGRFTTGLSAVFVGEKAYRNYIVRQFLDGDYIAVVSAWDSYGEKLKDSEYYPEVNLLHAISALESGIVDVGEPKLTDIAMGGKHPYRGIALDSLFSYQYTSGRTRQLKNIARDVTAFTPYALSVYVNALSDTGEHQKVIELLDGRTLPDTGGTFFIDALLVARYFTGDFDGAVALVDKAGAAAKPYAADAFINLGRLDDAEALVNELPASSIQHLMLGKIAVMRGNDERIAMELRFLETDEDRLNLLFSYVKKNLPAVDPAMINRFVFENRQLEDYVFFYAGIAELAAGDHRAAANSLDKVTFIRELITSSYFYRGMAYVYIDTDRAEYLFIRYLNDAGNESRVSVAKYMIAQLRFLDGKADDALLLLEDCDADYCRVLRAEVFLAEKRPEDALSAVSNMSGDRVAVVRAAVHYNRKEYTLALARLKNVKTPTDASDELAMLANFKLNRVDAAMAYQKRRPENDAMFAAAAENLFLAGHYKRSITLLNSRQTLTASMRLTEAKALTSLGRHDEARAIYKELAADGYALYDTLSGILAAQSTRQDPEQLAAFSADLTAAPDFSGKDELLIEAARMALAANEIPVTLKLLNTFFAEHEGSPHEVDALLVRARLFAATGRYADCVADADAVIRRTRTDVLEASFVKARCLEPVDESAALALYEKLGAEDSARFAEPAAAKVIELSGDADAILKAAKVFRSTDPELYHDGLLAHVRLLRPEKLPAAADVINELVKTRQETYAAPAYFYLGMMEEQRGDDNEALKAYLKGFYLYPDSGWKKSTLRNAAAIYDERGETDKAAELKKKI